MPLIAVKFVLSLSLSLSLSGRILSDLGYRVVGHGGVSRGIKGGCSAEVRDRTERDDKRSWRKWSCVARRGV